MTDTYCIDYNNYLADGNDDDENDDDGNDDVKQRRRWRCHVFLQRVKTPIFRRHPNPAILTKSIEQ